MRRWAIACAAALLAGCAVSRETIEIRVPIAVRPEPPPELLERPTAPPPVFVSPQHPEASSALTPAGERALQVFLLELASRLAAWEAWATAPPDAMEAPP